MSGLSCPVGVPYLCWRWLDLITVFARQVWRLSDGQVRGGEVGAADLKSRAPQAAVPDLPSDFDYSATKMER